MKRHDEKRKYERKDIHRLALDKVLFSVRYRELLEIDMTTFISSFSDKMSNKFKYYDFEKSNDIRLNFNSDEISDESSEKNYSHVFSFKDENCDYKLIIQKDAAVLEINITEDSKPMISYFELMDDLVEILKTLKFFNPVSLGMKKFNSFMIYSDKLEHLEDIFEEDFLLIRGQKNLYNKVISASYGYEEYNYHIDRRLQYGHIDDQPGYLISFDYDVVIEKQDVLDKRINEINKTFTEINDKIFDIFINSFKKTFIDQWLTVKSNPVYLIKE